MTHTRKAIATRRKIVNCAADLIISHGYSRMRLEEVLRASSVQKGNFYYYFRSKDELGMAVLSENLQPAAQEWLETMLKDSGDAWRDIEQLPGQLADSVKQEGNSLSVINQLAQDLCRAGTEFHTQAAEALKALSRVLSAKFEALRSAGRLDAGSEPTQLGDYLASVIDGALFWHLMTGDSAQLKRTINLGVAALQPLIRTKA